MDKPLITFEYNGEERKFVCHSKDGIYNVMSHDKQYYEMDLLNYIRSLELKGVYVDVGAFIGTHTVFFSKECKGCTRVYSFECLHDSYKLLMNNVANNDCENVLCFCVPILDKYCQVQIIRSSEDDLGRTKVLKGGNYLAATFSCLATYLDSIIRLYLKSWLNKKIVLIKIDVEGNELLVLKGAQGIIDKWHPILLTEVFRESNMLKEIAAFLVPLGYKVINKFCHTPVYVWKWSGKS